MKLPVLRDFCLCHKDKGSHQGDGEGLQLMPRSSPTSVSSCPQPCQASPGH